MKGLEGQVAIVTGGGTGIGRSTALMLAAEGARVVIAGRRKPPLDEVVAEVEKAGGVCAARVADLGKAADAVELARWTIERFGRVDVLVNNAGHSSKARNVRYVDVEEWEQVVAVNLTGVYALTQAVLPGMIERGGGTIITVSLHGRAEAGIDRRGAVRRGQGRRAQPHGPRAQRAARQGHPGDDHHAGGGRYADPRQSAARAGRRRPGRP